MICSMYGVEGTTYLIFRFISYTMVQPFTTKCAVRLPNHIQRLYLGHENIELEWDLCFCMERI